MKRKDKQERERGRTGGQADSWTAIKGGQAGQFDSYNRGTGRTAGQL
jgi:hypothetical protein